MGSFNRLKEIREKKHITQIRLSIETGVAQETISSYENGKAEPKLDKVVKLADFLNTSTDYLLGRTNDDSPLVDLANNVVDEKLNELINNYARLNDLKRKDLVWYSGVLTEKEDN